MRTSSQTGAEIKVRGLGPKAQKLQAARRKSRQSREWLETQSPVRPTVSVEAQKTPSPGTKASSPAQSYLTKALRSELCRSIDLRRALFVTKMVCWPSTMPDNVASRCDGAPSIECRVSPDADARIGQIAGGLRPCRHAHTRCLVLELRDRDFATNLANAGSTKRRSRAGPLGPVAQALLPQVETPTGETAAHAAFKKNSPCSARSSKTTHSLRTPRSPNWSQTDLQIHQQRNQHAACKWR